MLKTETSFDPPLATYRNLPEKSTVASLGSVPAANGDPATVVRLPVEVSTKYADTLFEP
jgi:hypothetical protein